MIRAGLPVDLAAGPDLPAWLGRFVLAPPSGGGAIELAAIKDRWQCSSGGSAATLA